jgi:hypothetical protein
MQRTVGRSPKVAHDPGLVLEVTADDIERAFQPLVEVRMLPLRFVDVREVLQVGDDLAYPRQTLGRLPEQVGNVLAQEFDFAVLTRLLGCAPRRVVGSQSGDGRRVGIGDVEQLADVVLERTEVGADEADRVVDLVRDAGGQLADGRHLLRLQQLTLRPLDGFQCLLQCRLFVQQFGVGALQLVRTFGDLLFETGIEFAETGLRRVQLVVDLHQGAVALRDDREEVDQGPGKHGLCRLAAALATQLDCFRRAVLVGNQSQLARQVLVFDENVEGQPTGEKA